MELLSRISTADVSAGAAFAEFAAAFDAPPIPVAVSCDNPAGFRGWRSRYRFGPVFLHYMGMGPCQFVREPNAGGTQDGAYSFLLFVNEGEGELVCRGTGEKLVAGSTVLIGGRQGFALDNKSQARAMSVVMDQAWAEQWFLTSDEDGQRSFDRQSGWGRALASFLSALSIKGAAGMPLPADIVAGQLAALVTLASGPVARTAGTSHRQSLLRRVRDVMRGQYWDMSISPASVAAEVGVSKRYIHALFNSAGTTFGVELLELRLCTAHALLRDRRHDGKAVAEIAS